MMNEFTYDNRVYYNPIEFAMAYIGGTWKIPILLSLRQGPVRYGDLKKAIPHISDKMLFTQLRELESKNMLTKHTFTEKPPRVEYQLTEKAQNAFPVIDLLEAYGIFLMKEAQPPLPTKK
ncbi:DNA-binding HxlR family transcriptional regulator [Pedobacter africanus]|uniref:DNA-binding HxlR family transcriptional regulator n=1 Tax=Pedobacter africanus TaxID=151894 RepID=A0ACC6KRK9_9SPHI|nr:helix-turn-helix domain-containing protein [Pedobacter africanus]MDR6781894.1 DNA-binding HxlR family transcriptional regulator [Pedobacter africanus]